MEFILMLIAFFNLNVAPGDLSDAEIQELENEYYESQSATDTDGGIRREIQQIRQNL